MNLIGQKFGRLTVVGAAAPKGPGRWWDCSCECGKHTVRSTGKLRENQNRNQSCGCANAESIRIASAAAWKVTTKFNHPLKQRLKWMIGNMVKRCHRPGSRRWERYGGRGIRVCDAWRFNRTAFFEWAIANGFKEGLSIERINHDGDYCPENCRFASPKEQANNTSRNRFLTWNGVTLTVAQWAERMGVHNQALQHRVDRGWDLERIFEQPFRRRVA
jgi:hypothetical protein